MNNELKKIMAQAEALQAQMQAAQKEIASLTLTGESGAGLVTVTMDGRQEVTKVKINPALLEEDITMLEDLIVAAFNNAKTKVEKEQRERLGKVTAGLNLPGDFNLPTS
jgi:DNA-binding YbaB/EbfC family protein